MAMLSSTIWKLVLNRIEEMKFDTISFISCRVLWCFVIVLIYLSPYLITYFALHLLDGILYAKSLIIQTAFRFLKLASQTSSFKNCPRLLDYLLASSPRVLPKAINETNCYIKYAITSLLFCWRSSVDKFVCMLVHLRRNVGLC